MLRVFLFKKKYLLRAAFSCHLPFSQKTWQEPKQSNNQNTKIPTRYWFALNYNALCR